MTNIEKRSLLVQSISEINRTLLACKLEDYDFILKCARRLETLYQQKADVENEILNSLEEERRITILTGRN